VTSETVIPRVAVPLRKSVAALVFVLGWGVAITLWSLVHLSSDFATRGFIADVGIIFASIAVAAPVLASRTELTVALILGAIGIALFAITGYLHITVLVYTLRLLVPLLALLAGMNALSNSVKIFNK
jgi:hypothetical protein